MRTIAFLAAAVVLSSPLFAAAQATPATTAPTLPAFPGAEGYGAFTIGGRGGSVYEVTTLADYDPKTEKPIPGSLRDAVSKSHRTVVFRVAGYIDLKTTLSITQPFITVAGQTAPGGGICTRYWPFGVATNDVVIRFVRGRLGDLNGEEDALDIFNGSSNIIFDHCSATWSVDECLSTSGRNENCTIQWCLIGESLNDSIHSKGKHGYGSLARADGPMSWYHNLWAHNTARNPRLGDAYGNGHPEFDVRNNVIYDFGEIASGLTQGHFTVNYVDNYLRAGPSSKAKFPIHMGPDSDISFFLKGNVMDGNDDFTAHNEKFVDALELQGKPVAKVVNTPFKSPVYHDMSAEEGLRQILASVGAVLPARDSVDARIVDSVRTRGGKIIDSQKEVGGWPEIKTAPAPVDSDHDGIPDAWETAHGLNPNDPSDAQKDSNGDGYTNLEKYLDGIDPSKKIDYRDPKNNIDPLTAPMLQAAK